MVLVCASPLTRGPLKGQPATGTRAGFRRHERAAEQSCDPCESAELAYRSERLLRDGHHPRLAVPTTTVRTCAGCGAQWCNVPPGPGRRRRGGPVKWCSQSCLDAVTRGWSTDPARACRICNTPIPKRHAYCDGCRPPQRRELPRAERLRLFDRDGWKCQICFDPLDPGDFQSVLSHTGVVTRRFGPNYPTLDHVIPRSAGGDDSDDNLRAAHWQCNTVRGPARVYAAA
jgi:5-methylcytosine-specific restriction endonuclease McrA